MIGEDVGSDWLFNFGFIEKDFVFCFDIVDFDFDDFVIRDYVNML